MRVLALLAMAFLGCAPSLGGAGDDAVSVLGGVRVHAAVESHGSPVSLDAFVHAAGDAACVCVGEQHDAGAHHTLHARLLAEWSGLARGAKADLGLGLEMFEATSQPTLDAFASGASTWSGLLEASDWAHRWGHAAEPYRVLFEMARGEGLVFRALNASRELTRAIAREGLEDLTPELRAQLPMLDLEDEAHRRFFVASMGEHAHAGSIESLYAAQVVWDETMAERAAEWLLGAGGRPRRLVIVAGNGHCHRSAIPARLERRLAARGAASGRVVSVLTRTHGGELPPFAVSDYVLTAHE